jgi:hypothetical protein
MRRNSEILLRRVIISVVLLLCFCIARGQEYNRRAVCGSDTQQVRYVSLRTGDLVNFPAFSCKQVSRWGIRPEIGGSSYIYTPETARWLGRHNGGSFALYVAYGNFSIGARFVLTTVRPQTELVLDGKPLTNEAQLNPIKEEYSAGYSLNLKYNICLEPFVAVTSNKFYVVNEDTLKKHYQIPHVNGFTAGIGFNKYFRIREFQFLAIFVRYGHGFTNFRKVNRDLGSGYSEWCMGVAYKGFANKYFMKPAGRTDGLRPVYPPSVMTGGISRTLHLIPLFQ